MNIQIRERAIKFVKVYIIRQIQLLILRRTVVHVHGPLEVDYASDQLIALCLARDAALYIRSFIEHYFSLGVKHIFLLDNGSSDETVRIATSYSGITVLSTRYPFRWYKMAISRRKAFQNLNRF